MLDIGCYSVCIFSLRLTSPPKSSQVYSGIGDVQVDNQYLGVQAEWAGCEHLTCHYVYPFEDRHFVFLADSARYKLERL
jgi:hypothetical protein